MRTAICKISATPRKAKLIRTHVDLQTYNPRPVFHDLRTPFSAHVALACRRVCICPDEHGYAWI